jgi:hypothetical protein
MGGHGSERRCLRFRHRRALWPQTAHRAGREASEIVGLAGAQVTLACRSPSINPRRNGCA